MNGFIGFRYIDHKNIFIIVRYIRPPETVPSDQLPTRSFLPEVEWPHRALSSSSTTFLNLFQSVLVEFLKGLWKPLGRLILKDISWSDIWSPPVPNHRPIHDRERNVNYRLPITISKSLRVTKVTSVKPVKNKFQNRITPRKGLSVEVTSFASNLTHFF